MARSVFFFDKVPFGQRLAETIAWCAPRVRGDDPRHSLRSDELRPSYLENSRESSVRTVASRRERAVKLDPASGPASRRAGRLLVYFPDANLADGAAEVASRGFFDVDNVPPWDTWIALANDGPAIVDSSFHEYVIAWVPRELIGEAQAGIDVNPEECIVWLDDVDVRARAELDHLLR